jgi:hypothetical protein
MAHHKRRKRRKGGIKGCCGLCCLATTDGRRNGRKLTLQERSSVLSHKEALVDVRESLPRKDPPLRGPFGGWR